MASTMRRARSGFTLVEVLISALIFFVVLLAIFQLFDRGHATYVSGTRKVNVQQNARLAMDEMVRDLRMAGYRPESQATNPQPVRVGAATGIAVIGAWGAAATSTILVYCYDAANEVIRRRENGDPAVATAFNNCSAGEVIAQGVTAFSLSYYGVDTSVVPNLNNVLLPAPLDGQTLNGAVPAGATTNRDALRTMLVTMTVREDVPHQAPQMYRLTSTIRLRNLGI